MFFRRRRRHVSLTTARRTGRDRKGRAQHSQHGFAFAFAFVLLGHLKLRRANFLASQMPLPGHCAGPPMRSVAGFRSQEQCKV